MQLELIVIWSGALLILYIGRLLASAIWTRVKARRLGCGPVPHYPHILPIGLDLFYIRRKAIRENRYSQLYLDHFNRYGTTWTETSLGGGLNINTSETENIQAVGALKWEDYKKNLTRAKAIVPIVGNGITFQDGPEWKHSREMIKPAFKRAELSDVDSFKTFVDRFLERIPRDGSTVDLQPLLRKLFVDSSTYFVFGRSIDSLLDSPQSYDFLDAFEKSLAEAGRRTFQAGPFSFLFRSSDESWKKDYGKIHAYVDREATRALNELEVSDGEKPSDKPGRYVLVDEMAKQIKDPIALRSSLLHAWLPATDSTSRAVANSLFYIARNPEMWADLRQRSLALGDTPLTFETLKSLHYFRYTMFEGIRMNGPAGRIQRIAIRDTVLPRGGGPDGSAPTFVPKGTMVTLSNQPKYRDPKIWGEDVEAFRPGRYEGKVLGWDFTPFFGGPRICPAQQLVISQSVYLLIRLTREFETMENRDEVFEYVEQIKINAESGNGVKVALHPAKDN